jgi:purine-binding chemotaxis protein CheW
MATKDTAAEERRTVQVVEFLLGKEHFAIDLFDVREVVEYTTITKLPQVPPYVKGIIDLRGEITTIIDLKERLNIREGAEVADEARRIIVLDEQNMKSKLGVMVDDVSSVSTFELEQVDQSSASFSKEDSAILGIIKKKVRVKDRDETDLVIWIDIRKILADLESGR